MRTSCKNLHTTLSTFGYGYTYKYIKNSCEAYGRDVRAYLNAGSVDERKRIEDILTINNISFNKNYFPGSPVVEVLVTYFKATGWDE